MRILLISPQSEYDMYVNLLHDIPYLSCMTSKNSGTNMAPLVLVTIAALTLSKHELFIHDENVHGPVEPLLEKTDYDIIGISMITNQFNRVFKITEFCKKNMLPSAVVIGGAGTAHMPQGLNQFVDVVFFGEAEETWPQFLRDFEEGNHKSFYQHVSKPDILKSPIPRWDIIREDLSTYTAGQVQTTRGCPFDCVYCDVIYIYGRKSRSKPIEQVLEEIRILEDMGVKIIFFADDNFGGNKRYAKELLREVIKLNNSFKFPAGFITQADITIANDEELLQLMADCNFMEVLIGIESISKESLKDFNKLQNLRLNLSEAIHKIQSYGIIVLGSMIIGADSDDKGVFKRTGDFLKEANITDHACQPLMAQCGTKLWYQLKREGRLVELDDKESHKLGRLANIITLTNIVPKKMTRIELFEGMADYWETVFDPLHFMERAVGFVKGVKRKPNVKQPKLRAMWFYRKKMFQMAFRMLWFYFFQVTPDHRKAFFTVLRTTQKVAPYLVPRMIFAHTAFMIGHKRAIVGAKLARERAARERTHPEEIISVDRSLPIPLKVRESAADIFAAAYSRVRKKVMDRETLYKLVIEAMIDYIDRFGESFEGFNEHQLHYLNESCDRILAHISLPQPNETSDLSKERPPSGFEREILDALDHAIRIRECIMA